MAWLLYLARPIVQDHIPLLWLLWQEPQMSLTPQRVQQSLVIILEQFGSTAVLVNCPGKGTSRVEVNRWRGKQKRTAKNDVLRDGTVVPGEPRQCAGKPNGRSMFRVETLNIVSIQNHVLDVNGRWYRLTSENPLGQVDQLFSISFGPERDRSHDA